MRRTIRILLSLTFVLCVLALIAWTMFSPDVPFRWQPQIRPAQVALSPPNKEGLVTATRPLLTQVAPGDPLAIAIHWQRPNGAIHVGDALADREHNFPFARDETLGTMRFEVKLPSGEDFTASVDNASIRAGQRLGFYYMPTYYFALDRDGISVLMPAGGGRIGAEPDRYAWNAGKKLDCAQLGIYEISISGQILREGAPSIKFVSAITPIERTAGIDSQDVLRAYPRTNERLATYG